jgi:membrane protease YdiL (CAAX protease family)
VLFFIAGVFEELGWQGYAYDRLQERWGALKASILLGIFWAVYHLIPDVQNDQKASWILWHRLGTIINRVLIGWIYEHTGSSVFGTILYHVMSNLSWALFPNNGSHFDPMVTTTITGLSLLLPFWISGRSQR